MRRTIQNLVKAKPCDVPKMESKLLQPQSHNDKENQPFPVNQFTEHMATRPDKVETPKTVEFTAGKRFMENVERAIHRAPDGKAAGCNEIFVEALKIDPSFYSKRLTKFWKECGEMKYMFQDRNKALLSTIHKNREVADIANYKPIAVMSHARKMTDVTIAMEIRKKYKLNEAQLGFQENTSTENAIVRHIRSCTDMSHMAVLDLKSAYDTVPRHKLMLCLKEPLPSNICHMIALTLQPMNIETKQDATKTIQSMAMEVTQGSPLSPTLFNVYIDAFPETIELSNPKNPEQTPHMEEWFCTLFADDVKLQATSQKRLQDLLNSAECWAFTLRMT